MQSVLAIGLVREEFTDSLKSILNFKIYIWSENDEKVFDTVLFWTRWVL